MSTIKQLQTKANSGPQYVLKMDGLDLYVSNRQPLTGINITDDIKKAMKFSVDFDNKETKQSIYTTIGQTVANNKSVKFEAVNL